MTSIGNLIGGRLADRIDPAYVIVGGMTLISVFLYGFMNTSSIAQLVFLALTGVSVGVTTPATIVLMFGFTR